MDDPLSSAADAAAQQARLRHRLSRPVKIGGLALLALPLALAGQQFRIELRSYALLAHFVNPDYSDPLLRWGTQNVAVQDLVLPIAGGSVRARLYSPAGVTHPPGMVVLHGVHHLGIDEPRLINFSRAAAGSGFAVLTPEIAALADYHVDDNAMAVVGEAPGWLQTQLGTGPVTVVGISFAGGLALLAGSDPRYAPHMRSLALMGPYDNLERVSRFLATSEAELPDGRRIPYPAHPYGSLVFVYSHLAQFFPASDLPAAHDALLLWLSEEPQNARAILPRLSASSRARMGLLFANQIESLRPQMLQAIAAATASLAEVSPQDHLGRLLVPVFVLHGASDDIIPPSETLWLEREIPAQEQRLILITPAFSHVDPQKHLGWYEEWQVVNFFAAVLRASG